MILIKKHIQRMWFLRWNLSPKNLKFGKLCNYEEKITRIWEPIIINAVSLILLLVIDTWCWLSSVNTLTVIVVYKQVQDHGFKFYRTCEYLSHFIWVFVSVYVCYYNLFIIMSHIDLLVELKFCLAYQNELLNFISGY